MNNKKFKIKKGDIIQYWNGNSGHCGVFSHLKNNQIFLYSSYPYTNWSLQGFNIPNELYACRIYPFYIKT